MDATYLLIRLAQALLAVLAMFAVKNDDHLSAVVLTLAVFFLPVFVFGTPVEVVFDDEEDRQ